MTRANLVVGAGIICCAASLIWLEGRFSRADHRKAKLLVSTYTVGQRAETFEQFIVRQHDGRLGEWQTEITDDCRGVVRVRWSLAGQPPTVYAWDVMVSTKEIFAVPESPGGKRLLERFHAAATELPPLDLPERAP